MAVPAITPPERTISFGPPTVYVPPEYDFQPGFTPAEAWEADAARDFLAWSAVVVVVSDLGGDDAIALDCSLDGVAWFPAIGVDREDLAFVTAIIADGSYEFPAGALLRWRQTGSASDPMVIVGTAPWFGADITLLPPLGRTLSFPAARAATRILTLRN